MLEAMIKRKGKKWNFGALVSLLTSARGSISHL